MFALNYQDKYDSNLSSPRFWEEYNLSFDKKFPQCPDGYVSSHTWDDSVNVYLTIYFYVLGCYTSVFWLGITKRQSDIDKNSARHLT